MYRKLSPLLLFVFLVSLTALGFAQDIILGSSDPGQILFTNAGFDSANLSFDGTCGSTPECLTGFGYDGSNVGTYSMWFVGGGGKSGNAGLGAPTNGVYPINMNGNVIDFTFSFGSSFLDGTVNLINVTDGSNAPRFIADLNITGSNIPGFPNGGFSEMDFVAYLGSNPTIDQVYSGQAPSTQGPLSSGEIVPSSTPEPGSFVLFGSGVLGFAGLLRRKLNR